MNIFLIILSVILIIIDILIFCPISIKLVYDDKLELRVGYLFPVFRILPRKPKSEAAKQKKEEKKKKKAAKKAAKESEKSQEKKKGSFIGEYKKTHGLDGLIELLETLAKTVLESAKKITDHTVISKMELHLLIGTEDAATTALTYGGVCSTVYPLISIIQNNVKTCRHKEYIFPCFTITETKISFVLKARIVPFFILSAAVKDLIGTLKTIAK